MKRAFCMFILVCCVLLVSASAKTLHVEPDGTYAIAVQEPAVDVVRLLQEQDTVLVDGVRYTLSGVQAYACGYDETIAKQFVLPQTITVNGSVYHVTKILEGAFLNCTRLETVTLEKNGMHVYTSAFEGCDNLTQVTLPGGIGILHEKVFYNCTKLQQINVTGEGDYYAVDGVLFRRKNDTVTLIHYPQAKADTSYQVPDEVTNIEWYAFAREDSRELHTLKHLDLNQVKEVGICAFENLSGLLTVDVGDALERLDNGAFAGCGLLTEIRLPNTIEYVSGTALQSCVNVKNYEVVGSTTEDPVFSVDGVLFSNGEYSSRDYESTNCIALCNYPAASSRTEYQVPDWVDVIDSEAFENASNLMHVTIPDGVKYIGSGAFTGCSAIQEIEIPGTVEIVGDFSLQNMRSLQTVILHEGVKSLGKTVFSGCGKLETVQFPATLETIGAEPFRNCLALQGVTVADGNPVYYDSEGCLFQKHTGENGGDALVIYPLASSVKTYEIPAGVTEIAEGAFAGAVNLKHFKVSKGNSAFYVKEGVLYTGTTLHSYPPQNPRASFHVLEGTTRIADFAFQDVSQLRKLTLPEGLEIVGESAFWQSMITRVEFPSGLKEIGRSAFLGSALESVALPETVANIGHQAFDYCNDLEYLEFRSRDAGVLASGRVAPHCDSLEYVYVPVGAQPDYVAALAGGALPAGVMVLEGPKGTVSEAKTCIAAVVGSDNPDEAQVEQAANSVLRLTKDEIKEIETDYLVEIDQLIQQSSGITPQVTSDVSGMTVSGLVLASGVTEDSEVQSVSLSVSDCSQNASLDNSLMAINVTMEVNGVAVQPKSDVMISVPMTDALRKAHESGKLRVKHRVSGWNFELVDFVVENDHLIFRADGFSEYLFTTDGDLVMTSESTVSIPEGYDGTLTVASYAENGQMLALQTARVSNGVAILLEPWEVTPAYCRAFLLDDESTAPLIGRGEWN